MLKNMLKGLVKGQDATKPIAGGMAVPDDSRYAIQDGAVYVPPVTLPTELADLKATDQQLFNVRLKEALEPFRAQFATPYAQGAPFYELAQSTVLFPLMEWNWQVRRYIVEQCHLAWERNPMAKTAVRYTRLFSVQDGMMRSYRCCMVEDVIEAFCNHPYNPIEEYEKSFVEALNTDGELFIRYTVGGLPDADGKVSGEPGEVVITPLRPWYIQWIQANPKNFREVYNYRYTGSISDSSGLNLDTFSEDIPAEEIEHITINRLPYEQRGRPELFSVLPYLEAYKRWLQDRAKQNAFRGAIYDVTLTGATPAQVNSRLAAYRRPMMAGTVNVHNDNEEFKVLEQLVGANDASEDGRQIRLQVAAGMGIPEYMLSDGSNANLASATAQALPALKTFGEWQDIAVSLWTKIFKRVIRENVAAGIIPEMVPEERQDGTPIVDDTTGEPSMIKAEDAFEVTYSDLEGLDKLTTVQALLAVMNANLMSEQTATGLMPWPLDYDVEKARIDAENTKKMTDMLSGRIPMPPGIDPATGQPMPPGDKMGDDNMDMQDDMNMKNDKEKAEYEQD